MRRTGCILIVLLLSKWLVSQVNVKPQYLKTQFNDRQNLTHFFDTALLNNKVNHAIYIADKHGFDIQATHLFDSVHAFVVPGMVNAYCVANQKDPPYYKSKAIGKWNYALNHETSPEKNLGLCGFVAYTTQRDAKLIFSYTTPLPKGNYTLKILTDKGPTCFDLKLIVNGRNTYSLKSKIPNDTYEIELRDEQIRSLEIRTVQNNSEQIQFTLHGLYLEPIAKPALVVHQVPIIGPVFKGILKQSLFLKHLKEINPRLLIIDPGVSHILHEYDPYETKPEISKVLKGIKIQMQGLTVICVSPQETYRFSYPIAETALFSRDLKQICFEHKMAFLDWYAASGANGSAKLWYDHGLLQTNKVYLNDKGCRNKESLLSSAIKNAQDEVLFKKSTALVIPDYIASIATTKAENNDSEPEDDKPRRIVHEVGKGQNLYRISLAYDVQPEDIMKWNELPTDQVQAGQLLIIFKDNKRKDLPDIPKIDQDHKSNKRVFHKVKAGETLYSIGKKHGTSIAKIKKLNKLKNSNIAIGQLLRVK